MEFPMKRCLLALSLAAVLGTTAVHANEPDTSGPEASDVVDPTDGGTRNKQPAPVQDLGPVSVSAALDLARNALSPETGSSQYVIDRNAIAQMPLGAATPLNQVLLRAPGVVQDSHGSVHVRGDHANLQYRINGVMIPESIGGFGQTLDTHMIHTIKLLDGALPAQYGLRTAAVVDITTRTGKDLGQGGNVGITTGSQGLLNPKIGRAHV